MVNTFLVYSDFTKSARQLDFRRLGKQRVEAFQILNILQDLCMLSKKFGVPRVDCSVKEWIREVKRVYVSSDKRYIYREGKLIRTSRLKFSSIKRSATTRKVSLGFCFHPAVLMWYGHEEALKEYIDAHITEWVRRGYRNTMKTYGKTSTIKPSWCHDRTVLKSHRAALLKKETDREEDEWYSRKKDFREAGEFAGYVWPS